MQSGRAVSALYAAREAALARDPRGAAGTFLSRRIAAGKEKYPEKKPGTLIFSSGAAFKFIKAAVRRPEPRLFFPHLKRRRERKAAQKKGLGSRRRGENIVLRILRSENGGGPARAAERRARRSGQRSLRGVNFATARSARSGHGTRGRPSGQHNRELHSATQTHPLNPSQNLFPTQPKENFFLCPRLIQRGALRMHMFPRRSGRTGAQAIRAHDFFSGRFS